jgi:hypothetical protein
MGSVVSVGVMGSVGLATDSHPEATVNGVADDYARNLRADRRNRRLVHGAGTTSASQGTGPLTPPPLERGIWR